MVFGAVLLDQTRSVKTEVRKKSEATNPEPVPAKSRGGSLFRGAASTLFNLWISGLVMRIPVLFYMVAGLGKFQPDAPQRQNHDFRQDETPDQVPEKYRRGTVITIAVVLNHRRDDGA